MNAIVNTLAETEPALRCMTTETTVSEDIYSTAPLIASHSIYRQYNEDELHSSFEEAISDRVFALNKQLKRLSVPLIGIVPVQSSMYSHVELSAEPTHFSSLNLDIRQIMLMISIAFMLIMVGFDLMGLLILLKF